MAESCQLGLDPILYKIRGTYFKESNMGDAEIYKETYQNLYIEFIVIDNQVILFLIQIK